MLILSRSKLQDVRHNMKETKKGYKHSSKNNTKYFEKHHIIPICLGGTNDNSNLILLTNREHYIAHWMLTKIYPKEKGLIYALWKMTCCNGNILKSSIVYNNMRSNYINRISGKNSPMFGIPKTQEHKDKISKTLTGRNISDDIKSKISKSHIGKILSEEHKNNIKYAKIGVKRPEFTQEHKNNISKAMIKSNKHPCNGRMPWNVPSVKNCELLYNWTQLDKIYDIWIINGYKPWKLGKNLLMLDNNLKFSVTSFKNMIKWFLEHGDPRNHEKWMSFKKSTSA